MWIQWLLWLCNHEGVCKHPTWYGYHLALIFIFAFNQNGYFVIEDHITIIYDMGTIRMDFFKFTFNTTELVSVWKQIIILSIIVVLLSTQITVIFVSKMRNGSK